MEAATHILRFQSWDPEGRCQDSRPVVLARKEGSGALVPLSGVQWEPLPARDFFSFFLFWVVISTFHNLL